MYYFNTVTDESTLVSRAAAGDTSAYELLVRQHESLCLRTAYAITRDPEEAKDATQDAFLKAFHNLSRFRPGAPFKPWIQQIAANEARNRRVAAGRRAALADRAAATIAAESVLAYTDSSPELTALSAERRDALIAALNSMRTEDRLAIASRYFLDLSEAEMAERLGWPRGTVKSRLSRALGRLRHRLVAAAVIALLILLGLTAHPATRGVIADRLGIVGIRITHVPFRSDPPSAGSSDVGRGTDDPSVAVPTGLTSAQLALRLSLGEPVTLDEARTRVRYTLLLPTDRSLGPPDDAFVTHAIPEGQVSLVYRRRAGLPPTRETGVALLLSQFRGSLDPELYAKMAGSNTRIERVLVNGAEGVWLEGAPHSVMIRGASGQMLADNVRLAANVLGWTRNGLTIRLEGAFDKETALRIANSVR